MPSKGDITKRTLYYERIITNGVERIFFKPFCQVVIATHQGGNGRLWEPRDMVRNSMVQVFEPKEIHEIVEWDAKAGLLKSANEPDGAPLTLHSFGGFDWPITS